MIRLKKMFKKAVYAKLVPTSKKIKRKLEALDRIEGALGSSSLKDDEIGECVALARLMKG